MQVKRILTEAQRAQREDGRGGRLSVFGWSLTMVHDPVEGEIEDRNGGGRFDRRRIWSGGRYRARTCDIQRVKLALCQLS